MAMPITSRSQRPMAVSRAERSLLTDWWCRLSWLSWRQYLRIASRMPIASTSSALRTISPERACAWLPDTLAAFTARAVLHSVNTATTISSRMPTTIASASREWMK